MNNYESLEIAIEAHEYCEKLYSGMGSLVNNINDRNLDDLEVYFKNILSGFNWVMEVIILLRDLHKENIDLAITQKKISEYNEAYNNLDLLLLSDIIEYEMMPEVEMAYNLLSETIMRLQNTKQ
ncbi:hypothetical protein [Clostridium manihotivorum]|uniref:DUF8042 domain-containing protein n=1 Tax=Clostridium manihotivorum TaxID=2320868 RepID=A0A410DRI7_9CLOT|nr:hypothetical protein [Clostridium manihotivorum]QAA31658.1 hypothetical protein C1I91_08370 [Clostridium manihotivorum]